MGRTSEELYLLITGESSGAREALSKLRESVDDLNARLGVVTDDTLSGFTKITLAVGAIAGAVAALTGTIVAFGDRGSEVNDIRAAFDRLNTSIGVDSVAALKALREGTAGLVSDFDLQKRANTALSAGLKLSVDDYRTVGEAARSLAKIQGGEVSDSYDKILMALQTGRTRGLAMLGVTIASKDALADLKESLQEAGEHTSTVAELQAKQTAIMEGLRKKVEELGHQHLDFKEKVEAAKATVRNIVDAFEAAVAESPVVGTALDLVLTHLEAAFGGSQTELIARWVGWIETAAQYVSEFAASVIDLAAATVDRLKVMKAGWEELPQPIRDVVIGIGALTAAIWVVNTAIASLGLVGLVAGIGQFVLAVEAAAMSLIGGSGLAGAAGMAVTPIGQIAIAVASLTATVYALKIAWDLWNQSAARARDEAQQQVQDQRAIAEATRLSGTAFTDAAAAYAYLNEHAKDLREQFYGVSDGMRQIWVDSQKTNAAMGIIVGEGFAGAETGAGGVSDAMKKLNKEVATLALAFTTMKANGATDKEIFKALEGSVTGLTLKFAELGSGVSASGVALQTSLAKIGEGLKLDDAIKKLNEEVDKYHSAMGILIASGAPAKDIVHDLGTTVDGLRMKYAELGLTIASLPPAQQQQIKDMEDQIRTSRLDELLSKAMKDAAGAAQKSAHEMNLGWAKEIHGMAADDLANSKIIEKNHDDTRIIIDQLEGDSLQAKFDMIEKEGDARKRSLKERGLLTQQALDAIDEWESYAAFKATLDWEKANKGIVASLADALQQIPAVIQNAMTGGGGVLGAIQGAGALMGSTLMGSLFKVGIKDADGNMQGGGGLGNALAGILPASFAKMIPGIGQAIGAAIGPLISEIGVLFGDHTGKDIFKQVGANWGVQLSDGLKKTITDDVAKYGGEVQATLMHITDIIAEKGGVVAFGVDLAIRKTHDLFSMIGTGQLSVANAGAEFDKTFGVIAPAAIDKATGMAKSSLLELIALDKQFGTESANVAAFIKTQQDTLAAGTVNVVGGLTDSIAKSKAQIDALQQQQVAALQAGDQLAAAKAAQKAEAVRATMLQSQDEFDRLSRMVLQSMNTEIASGKSSVDAVAAVGGAIDGLATAAQTAGFAGNAAFAELQRWRELTTTFKPLLDEVSGLNEMFAATYNLSGINQQAMDDFQAQGLAAYHEMTAAGFTQVEAEKQIKPLIEQVIKAHQEKGLIIDDNTQKLIDQMTADGELAGQQASTQQVLKEGLGEIITLLGGQLPEAWRTMAASAKAAAGSIVDALGTVADASTAANAAMFSAGSITPTVAGLAGTTPAGESLAGVARSNGSAAGDLTVTAILNLDSREAARAVIARQLELGYLSGVH